MPLSVSSSDTSASDFVTNVIQHLRQLSQIDIQSHWRLSLADLPVAQATQPETWDHWAIASLNARHHIPWTKGWQVLWLGQRLVVPSELHGYPLKGLMLRLALTWWAKDAQIFVNGKLVQSGDLFDCSTRILLSSTTQPGEVFNVALRLISPGHDDGALVRSVGTYEVPDLATAVCPEPGFVADELAVLQHYLTGFQPELLTELTEAIAHIAWTEVGDRLAFDQSLATVRQVLSPLGKWIKQRQINLLAHAHLDLAWLWTVDETWNAAERTFNSVLQLQQDFPELIFCHSSPALYAWLAVNRPELFAQIQQQIAAGRWEVVAGLWVEPELNLISGESLVRQVLYGQRYVQATLSDTTCKIAWLPDSFGFTWQLPQILKQGGVEYFVTQKLRWNDTTQFPYELFWWQAPDRTSILSFMSPPIGEGIDPIKMATYACTWEQKTGILSAFWLPGVGDHGGGPSRDMLEIARRWQRSPFFPQLAFGTALEYLAGLEEWGSRGVGDEGDGEDGEDGGDGGNEGNERDGGDGGCGSDQTYPLPPTPYPLPPTPYSLPPTPYPLPSLFGTLNFTWNSIEVATRLMRSRNDRIGSVSACCIRRRWWHRWRRR